MSAGREHRYDVTVEWTGNRGQGASGYKSYDRSHVIAAGDKPPITGSADPAFRGDPACWNPEDLLVASLSACHKLWYLHLCAVSGVVVVRSYLDNAVGVMAEGADGAGRFSVVTLRPHVVIEAGSDAQRAVQLHHDAHAYCFIANSVNFPIVVEPVIDVGA